ncbi:hypothetical protein POP12_138 [Pectobacterium phage POP12]|nr:hypothetical protein POP12_138 [Pectobacterium phage POP12]
MKYLDMLEAVCVGKIAYRESNLGVMVFREKDTIYREFRDGQKFIFIASMKEIHAEDWQVLDEVMHDFSNPCDPLMSLSCEKNHKQVKEVLCLQ